MKAVKKVSVALDEETLQRLDRETAERKTNSSQVIRERLQQAWKAEGEQGRPPRAAMSASRSSGRVRRGVQGSAGIAAGRAR